MIVDMVSIVKPRYALNNVFNKLGINVNLKYKVMHGRSDILIDMEKRQSNRRITETRARFGAKMRILINK